MLHDARTRLTADPSAVLYPAPKSTLPDHRYGQDDPVTVNSTLPNEVSPMKASARYTPGSQPRSGATKCIAPATIPSLFTSPSASAKSVPSGAPGTSTARSSQW